jgi:hypothetical protein
MTEGRTIIMLNPVQGHKALTAEVWPWCKAMLMAGSRVQVVAKPAKRSTEQNSRMWAMLAEISAQVDWYGRKLTAEEWKHVFTAALSKQDVVPGIDGGFVVLGKSTSRMTKGEMSELQTLMEAFGAEKGVRFSAHIDPETGEVLA